MRTKENMNKNNPLKLRVSQALAKIPVGNKITVFLAFYPEFTEGAGRYRLQNMLNLNITDESLVKKLEYVAETINQE